MAENENKNGEQDEWKALEDEKLSPEQKEQGKPIRREYEYRDSEGNFLGKAIVELDPEEISGFKHKTLQGKKGNGNKIRSLKLQDTEGREIDLMAMANEYNVPVVMASERLENYYYDEGRCVVPPQETQFDVGVLAHELGHASQDHEKRFEGIVRASEKRDDSKTLDQIANDIPGIAELIDFSKVDKDKVAELTKKQDSAVTIWKNSVEELEKCEKESKEARKIIESPFYEGQYQSDEYKQANKKLDELRARMETLRSISAQKFQEASEIVAERDALYGIPIEILDQILHAPEKILERDATHRALEWLKKLKGMGIDLFKKHRLKKNLSYAARYKKATDCLSSINNGIEGDVSDERDVETTVLEELKAALETYQSEEVRIKTPQGKRVTLKAQPK